MKTVCASEVFVPFGCLLQQKRFNLETNTKLWKKTLFIQRNSNDSPKSIGIADILKNPVLTKLLICVVSGTMHVSEKKMPK